jgi:caffeoyl-CoA O-methyltransferase
MNNIFEATDYYISHLFAQEDDALLNTLATLEQHNIDNASISPTQGKLLQVFATMCNAKRILELGTLGGYSTIWMARALPSDGELITLEADEKHAGVARKNIENAGLSGMVKILQGNALDILPTLSGPFDMIFIDADKQPYTEYFNHALRLSRPGTIIVADNVIRNGKILDENSTDEKVKGVQRFNKALSESDAVSSIILQTVGVKEYDGMAIAVVNHLSKIKQE